LLQNLIEDQNIEIKPENVKLPEERIGKTPGI
jgi:hypothetical protein